MHKVFLSLMLVLSLSTVASALVSQDQVVGIGAANGVLVGGSDFSLGTSTNLVQVSALQQTSSANDRTHLFQYEDGTLYQTAYAAGSGGVFGANQVGNALGAQAQQQDGSGSVDQDQFLGAVLSQGLNVSGPGAQGTVGAIDGYVGHQVQVAVSRTGMSLNISTLEIREAGSIRVGF